MASKADTKKVLLELLDGHVKNEPQGHKDSEIIIDDVKHEIVSFEVDLLVRDKASSLIAARVILTVRAISDGPKDPPTVALAAHIFTTTSPDLPSTKVILEKPPQDSTPTAPIPHRASTIPTRPITDAAGPRPPLAETYRAYLSTFMLADPAADGDLARFLHQPSVTHNSRALSTPAYHGLIQDVRAVVPDITCEIVDLVADEERQVVAARLRFAGTPVGPFAGVERPDGRAVRIGEIVFYWFDEGMIREVVSLLDVEWLGG